MKFKHVQTLKSLRKAALIMMALCFLPVPIGILLGLPVKQRLAADVAPIVEEVRELTGASEIDVRTGAIGSAGYLSRINVRDYCVFVSVTDGHRTLSLGERCWESVKAGRYIKDRGIRRPDAQPAKTQKAVI